MLSLVSTDELELRPLSMTRGARFRATGPDRFVGVDSGFVGETLEVVRAADGSISHLDLATYCFTRTPYASARRCPVGTTSRAGTERPAAARSAPGDDLSLLARSVRSARMVDV
ncbi:DUF7586 domain-containing protein [Arsenicicoccus piscis]|uniref:DUF7586 domain-containing protein n=1 Tax=Arsenicicoccus piscis TaxID=673954 RepID=UPI003D67C3A6